MLKSGARIGPGSGSNCSAVCLRSPTGSGGPCKRQQPGWPAAIPRSLGSQFGAATARATEVSGDERASRTAAIAEVIAVTLGTAAESFGLIETSSLPRQPRSMRLTPLGAALAEGKTPPAGEPGKRPPLEVSSSAEVIVRDATPLRVWSLSAFAELIDLGRRAGIG